MNGTQIIVPQRIESDRAPQLGITPRRTQQSQQRTWFEGIDSFLDAIADAPLDTRPTLQQLASWAEALSSEGLSRLYTHLDRDGWQTLNFQLLGQDVSLATVRTDGAKAYMRLSGSVFQRAAPNSMLVIENMIAPTVLGRGTGVNITAELLSALTDAYREAAARPTNSEAIAIPNQSPAER